MKRNIYLVLLGVLAFSFGLTSCEKIDSLDDYKSVDIGGTATAKLSGEYFVSLDQFDGTDWVDDVYSLGYVKIMVYNTASNRSDSVWIDDLNNWPMKIRSKVTVSDKSFTKTENEVSRYLFTKSLTSLKAGDTMALKLAYPVDVVITPLGGNKFSFAGREILQVNNGVVVFGTKTPQGNPTDSIMVEFGGTSDPGVRYRYAGYRRTGFLEDEH